MSRVKIVFPEPALWQTQIPIHIAYINYGRHLGNDSVLSIAHEARIRFLAYLGFAEDDICGRGIIMADACINYRQQANQGQVLNVALQCQNYTRNGFQLFYRLTDQQSNAVIAVLQTGLVFFDYESQKSTGMPEEFRTKVEQLQQQVSTKNE
jgi:acyl-CoA thioester hydrolase